MQLSQSTAEAAFGVIAMLTFIGLIVSNYLDTHHHVKFIWLRCPHVYGGVPYTGLCQNFLILLSPQVWG